MKLLLDNGKEVEIELEQRHSDNAIDVIAGGFFLLTLNCSGTFTRIGGVPDDLGFVLDKKEDAKYGRIKEKG